MKDTPSKMQIGPQRAVAGIGTSKMVSLQKETRRNVFSMIFRCVSQQEKISCA